MDNFDKTCRKIDWLKMAKARKTVKNLAEKKPQLRYLADFLDALSEVAVEKHGVKLSEVYPSASTAGFIKRVLDDQRLHDKMGEITMRFFSGQNKRRKKEGK